MGRTRALLPAIVGLAFAVLAPAALAQPTFHPRVGAALGLAPPATGHVKLSRADVASGAPTPVVYHGGTVMAGGVTVHTVFWAPSGFAFQGSPGAGIPTYEGLIQQFFTDVAHDSGAGGTCTTSECNAFTVLPQFAEGTSVGQITPGAYNISYNSAANSIDDGDPYPSKAVQCPSPAGTDTCITDGQVQTEIDHLIQSTPGTPRGLTNLWFVFLPPGVDECITLGSCGTSTFAGYHEVSNIAGHGMTVYAVAVDPTIEGQIPPGADPNGYPDAEATLDTAAHETVEAMTDPEGTGWTDPTSFEVGDKCEVGPQIGSPLGFAADGSPYNQVINGHQYLFQGMWANLDSGGSSGCVQSTTTTTNQLPLPQVNLRQFNPVITGNVNRASGGGIRVQVTLLRAGADGNPKVVARSSTTTAANGSWSLSLAPHAVGDDRDELDVNYSGTGAPQPSHQVILTGNGGNPASQNSGGWTGWLALDAGAALANSPGGSSVALAPCFQAGVLSFTFNGIPSAQSPNDFCNAQTDIASEASAPVTRRDVLTESSNDNRASSPPSGPTPNPLGALVSLTARVGEPGSISLFASPLAPVFTPGGVPTCIADLEAQAVACLGLVPRERYTVIDRRQRVTGTADSTGTVVEPVFVSGGDSVTLSNGSRTLTTLHVAHLRVGILGEETVLGAGRCQAGDYYGQPLASVPTGTSPGAPTSATNGGVALTGTICPTNGDATGLPTALIAQTDDLSGGLTETEVPDIQDTSPIEGETMYGSFVALAETGLTGPDNSLIPTDPISTVAVSIAPSAGGPTVFTAANVDTPDGVPVPALAPGSYTATWNLTDANGDLRVVQTRFVERRGLGSTGGPRVSCTFVGKQHHRIRCAVTFTGTNAHATGTVRIRIARGGHVVALGHGHVNKGNATITMRTLRQVKTGAWRITLVLSRAHHRPQTLVLTTVQVL